MKRWLWIILPAIVLLERPGFAAADLQSLIDQAQPGAVLQLPAGTYRGNFTIAKPLTLDGGGAAVLDGGGTGTVLWIKSPGVTVRRLQIERSGTILSREDSGIIIDDSAGDRVEDVRIRETLFGVQVRDSPDAVITGCDITGYPLDLGRRGDGVRLWYSPRGRIERNFVHGSRDVLAWYSDGTRFADNRIVDGRYGLHFMYSHQSVATGNTLLGGSVGVYVMYSNGIIVRGNHILGNRGPSGFGIAIKESDHFTVADNELIENREGIHLDSSPLLIAEEVSKMVRVEGNRVYRNDAGVAFVGLGGGTYFTHNDFVDNWQQVSTEGGHQGESHWSENYWSDYVGIDPSGSGFGMTPYRTTGVLDSISDENEGARLFRFGPAMIALEFASRAVPWVAPAAKAEDQRPAMAPWERYSSVPTRAPLLAAFGGLALLAILMGKAAA